MMNENDYSLIRVFDTAAEWVIYHINSLSDEDKYLRFGFIATEDQIRKYVEKSIQTVTTRTNADMWYAIKYDGEIVATLHVAIRENMAEFAFTTDSKHRNLGLGKTLFARGIQLVTEFSIDEIYLHMLSRNQAMKHIAKKFGLTVITEGPESESTIQISYPVPLSKVLNVKQLLIDKSIWDKVST